VAADPVARRLTLERVLEAGAMTLGNPRRFEAYAIITGVTRRHLVSSLRAIPGVEGVEIEEERV
jgi:hypothetical protein